MHLLRGGGAHQAAGGRLLADVPPRGLPFAGEVLFAVFGDLVEPVAFLADLERLHRQRQPLPSSPSPADRVGTRPAQRHRRCSCVDDWNCGEDSTKEGGICR